MGERIEWALRQAGYSQAEYAREIEVPAQNVNAWVKNRVRPGDSNLEEVAGRTGVTISWLRYGGVSPFAAGPASQVGQLLALANGAPDAEFGPRLSAWLTEEIDRIDQECATERERALAIDVRASALRVIMGIVAERAALRRADAAAKAEERALITCQATPDTDGDAAPAKRQRREVVPDRDTATTGETGG